MVVHTLNFAVIRMVWIQFGMPRLFRFLFVFLHSLHHIPFVDKPCWQIGYCGDLFSDLLSPLVSNRAQNGNRGSLKKSTGL